MGCIDVLLTSTPIFTTNPAKYKSFVNNDEINNNKSDLQLRAKFKWIYFFFALCINSQQCYGQFSTRVISYCWTPSKVNKLINNTAMSYSATMQKYNNIQLLPSYGVNIIDFIIWGKHRKLSTARVVVFPMTLTFEKTASRWLPT